MLFHAIIFRHSCNLRGIDIPASVFIGYGNILKYMGRRAALTDIILCYGVAELLFRICRFPRQRITDP